MSAIAKKSDPKLWDEVKARVTRAGKGGRPGEWSARKAQLATQEYKHEGGGYAGPKTPDNHLVEWTREEWNTKSGEPSGETGERYLPKTARQHLTADEYRRTTAKKRADTRRGKQFSPQPPDVATKTERDRKSAHAAQNQSSRRAPSLTKVELMAEARKAGIPNRSKMTKEQLAQAVGRRASNEA